LSASATEPLRTSRSTDWRGIMGASRPAMKATALQAAISSIASLRDGQ
jgi:hypothetical protein